MQTIAGDHDQRSRWPHRKAHSWKAAIALTAGNANASLFPSQWHRCAHGDYDGSACNSSRALPMRAAVCALVQQLSLAATPAQMRPARKPFQLF